VRRNSVAGPCIDIELIKVGQESQGESNQENQWNRQVTIVCNSLDAGKSKKELGRVLLKAVRVGHHSPVSVSSN
jgi:hypothetical protein